VKKEKVFGKEAGEGQSREQHKGGAYERLFGQLKTPEGNGRGGENRSEGEGRPTGVVSREKGDKEASNLSTRKESRIVEERRAVGISKKCPSIHEGKRVSET